MQGYGQCNGALLSLWRPGMWMSDTCRLQLEVTLAKRIPDPPCRRPYAFAHNFSNCNQTNEFFVQIDSVQVKTYISIISIRNLFLFCYVDRLLFLDCIIATLSVILTIDEKLVRNHTRYPEGNLLGESRNISFYVFEEEIEQKKTPGL